MTGISDDFQLYCWGFFCGTVGGIFLSFMVYGLVWSRL
jgi:hypothetical protein